MNEPILELINLRAQLPTSRGVLRAVDDVSFSIYPGETFSLVGESGCGKSFTALSVLQLLPENAYYSAHSKILFKGQDLLTLTERSLQKIRGRHIGMIFQEPLSALNPVLTVGYQINEVLRKHLHLSNRQANKRALELLDQVGIVDPQHCREAYPHQLSGGQRQRVCIAMALAGEPELLIADEPTTALDVTIQAQILDLLSDIQRKRNMSLLLITHDLAVVAKMATQVGVMYAGQLVETAPATQFFTAPKHPYSQCLFAALPQGKSRDKELQALHGHVPDLTKIFHACRFVGRCPAELPACSEHEIPWVTVNPEHAIRCDVPFSARAELDKSTPLPDSYDFKDKLATQPLLTVKDVQVYLTKRKWWQSKEITPTITDINFTLNARETLALVGESGCGKTTLAKTLLRFVPLSKGQITLNQATTPNLQHMSALEQAKWLQIVWQDPYSSLDPRQSVYDILAEALTATKSISKKNKDAAIKTLLDQVNLPSISAKRYPHQFSGGQRQRIAIARALAANPKILICDEPTSALDVSVQAQILNLLKELQAQHGLTYIIITHNMAIVEYLADTVAVMKAGRIVEYGPAEKVLKHPENPYTQLLWDSVPQIEPIHSRKQ
jgi:peptide/nickel transport system ATP-binding protein